MSESDAAAAVATATAATSSKAEELQPPAVEADAVIDKLVPGLSATLGSPASNPMDEIDTEEEEEEGDADTVVVPSNTPVTADSGQGSPAMQSSSESLNEEPVGQDSNASTTRVTPESTVVPSEASTTTAAPPCNGAESQPTEQRAPPAGQEVGQGESTAQAKDTSSREAKKLERKEEKKKQKKKEDKGIEYILRALNSLHTPEEKLAALCKKYADLNEEHRVLQTSFKTQQRTVTVVMREKDQLQAEHTRAMMAKSKLESLCRELQKHNKIIKEESIKRAKEDDDKRKEISAQFNNTIGEIQTQMSENTERNNKLKQENENLAAQLKAFINSIELRDQQVEKIQKHHELEKKLFEAKIKQADAVLTEHTEKNNKERELVMLKLAESNKKNAVLEAQVSMFKERYSEFEQLHSRSSETFQKYKTEMDKMTKRIKKLEKDGLQWKSKWENTNKALIEQMDARSKSEKETLTYAQKSRKLESLCRALQAELHNKKEAGDGAPDSTQAPETETAPPPNSASAPPNSPEASSSGQCSPDSTDDGSSDRQQLQQQQQQQQQSSPLPEGVSQSQPAAVSSSSSASNEEPPSPPESQVGAGTATATSTAEGETATATTTTTTTTSSENGTSQSSPATATPVAAQPTEPPNEIVA